MSRNKNKTTSDQFKGMLVVVFLWLRVIVGYVIIIAYFKLSLYDMNMLELNNEIYKSKFVTRFSSA